jgi:hypothetical protein
MFCAAIIAYMSIPTAVVCVRSQVKSWHIFGGQSSIVPGFLQVLRFLL